MGTPMEVGHFVTQVIKTHTLSYRADRQVQI